MKTWIGVDIGGTGVKLALIDEKASLLASGAFDTNPEEGFERFLSELKSAVCKMVAAVPGAEPVGCGIGCTGPVDINSGVILNPFTLPGLEGACLTAPVRELLGVPVWLENDANTAHLGEAAALEKDPGNTALITLGTGVGCSVRLGGELFRVPGGIHPEIGHTSCGVERDIVCYCGRTNCMENVLSGTAVNRDAQRFFGTTPENVLDCCDTEAKRQFREDLIRGMTSACATLAGIFTSKLIIVAGGMTEFYTKYILDEVNQRMIRLTPDFGTAEVVSARLGKNSGRLGAAVLALNQSKGNQ